MTFGKYKGASFDKAMEDQQYVFYLLRAIPPEKVGVESMKEFIVYVLEQWRDGYAAADVAANRIKNPMKPK